MRARSGFPITVLRNEEYIGIAFINAFRPTGPRPAALGRGYPRARRRRLNPAAFQPAGPAVKATWDATSIGGFGMYQLDLAVQPRIPIGDRKALQFRLEAFNAFNHPNFADPVKYLDSPLFGQSISMLNMMLGTGSPGSGLSPILQTGGPRPLQATVRIRF